MQTNISRLKFILAFSKMNLPALSAGYLLVLREDLAAFLGGGEVGMALQHKGGIIACPLVPPFPQDMPLADLEALQTELRTMFASIGAVGDMTLPPTKTIPIQARYALVSARVRRTPRQGTHLTVTGPTRDMVLLTTLWLLNQESADSIACCPECTTVFYRTGRQEYCSPLCRNRVAARQWRSQEENKQKNRDKAHAHYKTKKLAAGSPAVQRRPRKSPAVQMDALSIPGDISHEAHDF